MKFSIAIIAFFLLLLSILMFFGVKGKNANISAIITLNESGFTPKIITIHQGQTIQFTSTVKRDFWPASDPHPTHELYSAFDPQVPLKSGGSWNFTFNKIGKWKYHDHLFPYYRGIIIVIK